MTTQPNFPCPCCGYIVFEKGPGSYDICPICFWEDDISQLRFPETKGANKVSIIDAQRNFRSLGVCEEWLLRRVRKPGPDDRRDPDWRPLDPSIDDPERQVRGTDYGRTYPDDSTKLYYWRETYWRRPTQ